MIAVWEYDDEKNPATLFLNTLSESNDLISLGRLRHKDVPLQQKTCFK